MRLFSCGVVFGLAALAAASSWAAPPGPAADLYISSSFQPRLEEVLAAAGPGAQMMPRDRLSSVLRVQVPASRAAAARLRLTVAGFLVEHQEPSLFGGKDPFSLSGLLQLNKKRVASGLLKKLPDAPGAREYHIKMRGYPFNKVDYGHIRREAVIADGLKDHYIPPPAGQLAPSRWAFLGPRNLDIPFRVFFGQPPVGGRTSAVAYDPDNSSIIYAGGAMGGLWKSTDAGVTWRNLSNAWPAQTVNCILVLSGSEIMVGLGDLHGGLAYGTGIMRTTDGGQTWSPMNVSDLGSNQTVTHLLAVPGTSGNEIIATTGGGPELFGGIFKSFDRGISWARGETTPNLVWTGLSVGAPDSNGIRRYYAAAAGFSNRRLFASLDNGSSWGPVTIPQLLPGAGSFKPSYSVAASKLQPDRVFFLAPEEKLVLQSNDRGITWTDITDGIPRDFGDQVDFNWKQPFWNYNIETSTVPNADGSLADVVFVGLIDLAAFSPRFGTGAARWKSIGGPTYDGSKAVLHVDQQSFAVDPSNPHNMLAGNDGGVFRIAYNPANQRYTVTPLNREMGTHQFYHISVHPTNLRHIMGGLQDNSTANSQGDLNNWDNVCAGDGGFSFIHPFSPNTQYASAQGLFIQVTDDNWVTSTTISSSETFSVLGDRIPFIGAMELSKADPNILYAGTNFLHKWNNLTDTWETRLGDVELADEGVITAIETDRQNRDVIYVGTQSGHVLVTGNGGTTWRRMDTAPLPDRPIREINADPNNIGSLLVVLGGGPTTGPVWEFDSITSTWINRLGSPGNRIPNIPTNTIIRDPANQTNKWWVGNDLGVYVTEDRGTTWQDATGPLGMPAVIVNKLVLAGDDEHIIAGTFGRGAWRIRRNDLPTVASVTINPSVIPMQLGSALGTVTLEQPAREAVLVDLASSEAGLGVTLPAQIRVEAGEQTRDFIVSAETSSRTGVTQIRARVGTGPTAEAALTIREPVPISMSLVPGTVVGGENLLADVALETFPSQTISVRINSTNSSLVPPFDIRFDPNERQILADANTGLTPVSRVVTLSTPGPSGPISASVTIRPPFIKSIKFPKTDFGAGSTAPIQGTVELDGRAPAGGVVISLTSSVPSLLSVPATVTVPFNQRKAVFAATSSPSATDRTVLVTGRHTVEGVERSAQGFVVLRRSFVQSVSLSPRGVIGGQSSTLRINLNAPAPAGGLSVALSCDRTFLSLQSSILIPAGQSSVALNVITRMPPADRNEIITAATNAEARSTTLNLLRVGASRLQVSPSTIGGNQAATATVTLNGPAPTGGLTFAILNGNPGALNAPASVTVPAGATTRTFTVTGREVSANTGVALTVIRNNQGATTTVAVVP